MNTAHIRTALREKLETLADPAHRKGSRAFFKNEINPLGVRCKDLNALVAQQWRVVRHLDTLELLTLFNALWQSDVFEEPVVASKLCSRALPRFEPSVFDTFERWLSTRVSNWAHCDVLCTQCLGGLYALHPATAEKSLPWLASPNRWVRRGAAVSLVPLARHGLCCGQVFHVADALLEDEDDLVRKGYGWMLKELSHVWPREVLEFVHLRRARMPRVALRYAIELLPADWRARAMAKP